MKLSRKPRVRRDLDPFGTQRRVALAWLRNRYKHARGFVAAGWALEPLPLAGGYHCMRILLPFDAPMWMCEASVWR